ncbi:hypothetical protein HII31_04409 [Pseudocercospora fuligena]|uniref:Peptidase A1 domain-containing protein n=1 Tax=Pseudocercospora fuligena TaxID=685502 RepID=A0A8H6VKX7_9PEZI|nr:hypothetical protein HII31_04409 [Pseudocercospora fuligena]
MRKILAIYCGFGLIRSAFAFWEGPGHPLPLAPSGYWDGNDGKWSTFWMQIGTPPQLVRLLPGTSASTANLTRAITAEAIEGCLKANPDFDTFACNFIRGYVFQRNESTTWTAGLELSTNASYGFDTISLGPYGSYLPTLQHHIIEGISTDDIFLGSFPLSPLNFTFNTDGPVPSLLGKLRTVNNSVIPSTTWGYTAGAYYRSEYFLGSVILGGYDPNRIDLNDSKSISIPFNNDSSRDLVLGLLSITYNGSNSSPLLTDGIYAIIDSLIAQMWLPVEVCDAFEAAFGLRWDNETELYLVDDDIHENLVVLNPKFTFTIGASKDHGTNNTEIALPYAAFDLNISSPQNYSQSQRYFPIKRAQDAWQYTLGRVFLQEAYVIADYDRGNFTIGQTLFPSTLPSPSDITAILPPRASGGQRSANPGMATIAGVFVASIVTLIMSGTFVWW